MFRASAVVNEPRYATDENQAWGNCINYGLPNVDIEKATNGEDADTLTGPYIPVGGAVNWTYVVTNTGQIPLADIVVTDNKGVAVSCPATTLAVNASMICTGSRYSGSWSVREYWYCQCDEWKWIRY